MKNKERLERILREETPDAPPHFELVFQIEKEYFGMNPPHPEDRKGNLQYNLELQTKLVDEFNYAAVSPVASDPESIGLLKKELGSRALIAPHDWDGVFWMPSGDTLIDFVVRLYEKGETSSHLFTVSDPESELNQTRQNIYILPSLSICSAEL